MSKTGAKNEDWDFLVGLKLTNDLLPVVCDTKAAISPRSNMKALGKTPSQFGPDGVIGMGKWTKQKTTERQVERWKKEPDYGICLQTRNVRALDIDVDDKELADAIFNYIDDEHKFPVRYRDDSGKILLAFRIKDGEFTKRKFEVEDGIIEFLATGQQFIAFGQHQKGQRYKWFWPKDIDKDFPTITVAEFEKLWAGLHQHFGKGEATVRGIRKGSGKPTGEPDDIIDMLEEKGLILDWGNEGQAFIDCPFKDRHTMDSGISQTAYFPRGTRNYQKGHFVCLHAHCEGTPDEDFYTALKLDYNFPAVIDEETGAVAKVEPKLKLRFIVNTKTGEKEAVLHNLVTGIGSEPYIGQKIGFDKFRDELMICPAGKYDQWRSMEDVEQYELQLFLERKGFKPIATENMRKAVAIVGKHNQFDSAIDWLESRQWDGVPRIDNFVHNYFGGDDSEYTQAVGRYMWTGLAGRILQPGCQCDMVPVLQGEEGLQKSKSIRAIAPDPDFFSEMSFSEDDDKQTRKMRGRLVIEISELRGLQTRDAESILALITRTHENWTPKYKEYNHSLARRFLFFGTTNSLEFLPEGKRRRWLPFKITKADADAIARDREQLWAEGRELFKAHGVMWEDAETLARMEHRHFEAYDSWDDVIANWLDEVDLNERRNGDAVYLYAHDIFQEALKLDMKNVTRQHEMRLAKALRKAGYHTASKWNSVTKKSRRVWVKNPAHIEYLDLV